MTGAEELVQRGIPPHRTLHMRAHVGEDSRVRTALDHVDGQVLLRRRPDVLRESHLELGRLAVGDARDVTDLSPDDLLLSEEGGDEEADDRNAEQYGDDRTRNLSPENAELTAAQPPPSTKRHNG